MAQAEAATGGKWVNYWMHGEFLVTSNAKMSKSLENFITLSTLMEKGYDPLDYRYFCLGAHYRKQLNFSYEDLDAARTARNNIRRRIALLKEEVGRDAAKDNSASGGPESSRKAANKGDLPPQKKALSYLQSFQNNLLSDLNMPKCLSDLWNLLKDTEIGPEVKLRFALEMDKVLGLDLNDSETGQVPLDSELRHLIEARNKARLGKDYAKADEIRAKLEKRGIVLEDTPGGVRVKKKL